MIASDAATTLLVRRLADLRFREIAPQDWRRLQLFHRRLSDTSIQLRFHGAKRELSELLAHHFTQLDGQREVAIVATTGTRGRVIGVARYCWVSAGSAEAAFVVEDAYQGHGVGHRLMDHLRVRALDNGITEFIAEVREANVPMFRLLAGAGPTRTRRVQGGCEVRVHLAPDRQAQ